jgi:hypothetical protein
MKRSRLYKIQPPVGAEQRDDGARIIHATHINKSRPGARIRAAQKAAADAADAAVKAKVEAELATKAAEEKAA